jgi:hypothetical protein
MEPLPKFVNQTLPSGPVVIPIGKAMFVVGMFVTVPTGSAAPAGVAVAPMPINVDAHNTSAPVIDVILRPFMTTSDVPVVACVSSGR